MVIKAQCRTEAMADGGISDDDNPASPKSKSMSRMLFKIALLGIFLLVGSFRGMDLDVWKDVYSDISQDALVKEPRQKISSNESSSSTSLSTRVVLEASFQGVGTAGLHPSYLSGRKKCRKSSLYKSVPNLVRDSFRKLSDGPAAMKTGADRTAICVMQKNEDWFLEEWINYHFALGFDDIYLFNDGEPKMNLTSTEYLHVFPVANLPTRVHKQIAVYNSCVEIIQRRQPSYNTSWVSFMDIDEFLVLKRHDSVTEFLIEYCPPGLCGSLSINWLWFGTSNETYYAAKPVTQRFICRERNPHKISKSIFRLDAFYCASNQHFVHLKSNPAKDPKGPPFPYDTQGTIHFRGPGTPTANDSVAVFHHYTKSLEEWYVRRCVRGDVHRSHNLKCTGRYPEPGESRDTSAGDFYQAKVLDPMSSNDTTKTQKFVSVTWIPPWTHYPESKFEIKEFVTPSKVFDQLNSKP